MDSHNAHSGEHTESPRLRILYADDVRELRDVMQISLTHDGHQIECVEDGALALERVIGSPREFDLVITDHHMPRMNGLELVRQLRGVQYPGHIIVFTSEIARDVARDYGELGVDRILYKPIFPAELRQAIDEVMAATRGR